MESYGQEQVVVIDAIDCHILRAVVTHQMRPAQPAPVNDPNIAPAGLREAEVTYAWQEAGESPQARWDKVIAAYLDGHINLGRAATLLNLSSYELDERFRRLGVPRRVGPQTEKEARAEIQAAFDLIED